MYFSNKIELIKYVNDINNNINANNIINHLYYMKRTKQLYKYSFTNDELIFLENKFSIILHD